MSVRGAAEADAWVRPVAFVRDWLKRAAPGEELIYGRGTRLPCNETSTFVRDLAMRELVEPFQPRSKAGAGYDFIIRKRASALRLGSGQAADRDVGPKFDAPTWAIYRQLKREANLGLRASSNGQLAKACGLETGPQAAWRVAKLVGAGLIRSEVLTAGPHAGWRIVTIVATGQTTLGPPSWEAAKREMRGISVEGEPKAQARREIVK